jgi:D-alanyl-D-alanine carboxypeptidase
MVDMGLPGAGMYIEDADGTAHFFTAGFADLVTQQRMTADSRYRIGSTTKAFTATVILQLIAEHTLTLHDTVEQRLPDVPIPNAAHLTIEHLLRMRSGLFDFEDDPSLLGNLDAHLKPYTLHDTIALSLNHPAPNTPGTQFAYCNTNFCVLELIIERATGRSLGEHLTYRIFEPLSMTSSSYPAAHNLTLPEPYIRGYEYSQDGWRECSHIFFGRGDGALISTAIDQARFFRALLGGKLLPNSLLTQMMHIVEDVPPAEFTYGLGLMADTVSIGQVWGHAGGGFGYKNYPYIHRETGRFVVCMLNGTYGYKFSTDTQHDKPLRFSTELRSLAYTMSAA